MENFPSNNKSLDPEGTVTSPDNDQNEDQITEPEAKKNDSMPNRTLPLTENATNSHPLMYSPGSAMPLDFPDLIPEQVKNKYKEMKFNPEAHSTALENSTDSCDSFERQLNLPILDYNEKLPDFPKSPSALKKLLMYDLPVETSYDPTSDTENDKSIYEAHLSANLQNVSLTMNEKEGNLNFLAHNKRSNKLRRIRLAPKEETKESDNSSLDSDSDGSLKSDIFEEDAAKTKTDMDEDNNTSEPIEPLSAADERRHARNWQRMVLPGGEHRTIDMRVIEPYKRVLSHGGYLRAGGHTAIVLFAACYLPDRSRIDYDYVMDNLFLYILWTLERLVTDDYVMVYFHGAATKLPSFSWLKRCYEMVGRKLRKNLSHLYIVHPTFWIKTMLYMSKPFISSKFYRKITFIGNLRDLLSRVPLEAAAIPDKVKAFDSLHCTA
ncbi:protein prune homolog 2 [Euwallacea similis]|uniref:protein prune homolog 2 n=1 Tax=Euwallacea similis TaxID=1736056 RepID=UPI00344BE130